MVTKQPTLLGQPIAVPAGLKADCPSCRWVGRDPSLVTDGTEIADVVYETYWNGRYNTTTRRLAVWLPCPDDSDQVQFILPRDLAP